MSVPKSFKPLVPKSFDPLPAIRKAEIVPTNKQLPATHNSVSAHIQSIINSVPQQSLDAFQPILRESLAAIQNQVPAGGIAAWFMKYGAKQRGELYANQSTEINNLIALTRTQTSAWVAQVENAFAPVALRHRFEMECAQHQVTQATLEYQVGLILISEGIAKQAIAKGKPPDIYLQQLQLQVQREEKILEAKQQSDIKVEEDQRLKANARTDANLSAIDRINRATEAKMARRLQEKRFREDLDAAIAKRHRIAADSTLSDAMRADFLANVEDEIVGLKDQINELLGRNRQADSGQEA